MAEQTAAQELRLDSACRPRRSDWAKAGLPPHYDQIIEALSPVPRIEVRATVPRGNRIDKMATAHLEFARTITRRGAFRSDRPCLRRRLLWILQAA